MNILQSIALDFARETLPITVFAKQYDKESRTIAISPLNNGQNYALESGTTARLQLTKADGYTVINDCTVEDGVIMAELTEQCLVTAGVATAEIGLYKGTALLSSQTFYIDVKKSAYDANAPESSDEYNALVEALGEVTTSLEAIGAATEAAETATENANTAASAANSAAQAAAGAENLNARVEATATGATIYITNRAGVETSAHIDTLNAVETWEDIRNVVRMGLGATLFPVGYEFTTLDADTENNIVWVVRAHDHHTAENTRLMHTMTIEMKNVYSLASGTYKSLQFDSPEALYYAEEELAAGTYNFSLLAGYDTTYGGGKTLSFTLANPVPAGGVIMFPWAYQKQSTDTKISTYASNTATAAIETVPVTEAADGAALGTADGAGVLNHAHRIRYGSNNYAQSAARQWLNSSAAAGSVWAPQTKFDRPPSWVTTYNGFMHGLPSDFLAVVQAASIPCRTNGIHETNSLDGTAYTTNQVYTLSDKFFLLSRPEIWGTWDSTSYKDGELLDYYDGLTDTERKKYDENGSVRGVWLRSPYPSHAYVVRIVYTDGSVNGSLAGNSYGVAAACIIA